MPVGHKNFLMRGGTDFPSREISLKDIRALSRSAWEKWEREVPYRPIRELLGLAYAEGLYHGAVIAQRDRIDMIGTMAGSASSAAASAASSETIETPTLSVRDLLESL